MQGTHGWARVLDYFKAHPITAGGGANVICNHAADFSQLVTGPAAALPVVVGQMGPALDLGGSKPGDPVIQVKPLLAN